MMIPYLDRSADEFPSTDRALDYPNGLLAIGGDLSKERLVQAYSRGIFPWFEHPQPVMWWSPNPRSVLFPSELRVSRSLRRTLRRCGWKVTADQAFGQVIRGCAEPRGESQGTWITSEMNRAYIELHHAGIAHSIEVWDKDNSLVGGLYGVALGKVFFGESMYSRLPDASKVALTALARFLTQYDFTLIDCQVESAHLNSMGARNISRLDFEQQLAQTVNEKQCKGPWMLQQAAGELL